MRRTSSAAIRFMALCWLVVSSASTVSASGWFVSFEEQQVPPIERSDTTRLIEAGVVETDGFSELVFSLGGEFKEAIPTSGAVGAVLIPDIDVFIYLLRNEGEFVFPLEAKIDIRNRSSAIFVSEQQRVRVAFPRYRVFFYNETTSAAVASLYVYRTR